MRFKVYGPYNIGVEEGHANWIDKEDIKDFWEKRVVADNHKLPDACGVYLFGMRGLGKNGTAGKTLPWYVGKAEKQRFKTECFNFKNLYYFNSILINEYRGKGSPFLYLLARVEGEEFSPPASKEEFWGVRFVEEMFIQMSLSANSGLLNKSTTKMARETSIRGLLNTKKYKSASVDEFKGVLGINKERKPTDVAKYEETKFRYEVYGPYDVPIKNAAKVIDKAIDPEDVKQMWDELRNGGKGKGTIPLDACGVYVIGMRHGNNTTPWYVGTAYNSSFEKRCFESASEKNEVVKRKGKPVLYFLPRLTEKDALAKQVKKMPDDIDYVRRVLLEYGVQKNKDILFDTDVLDLKILRELYVDGFINSKPGKTKAVSELKSLLGQ